MLICIFPPFFLSVPSVGQGRSRSLIISSSSSLNSFRPLVISPGGYTWHGRIIFAPPPNKGYGLFTVTASCLAADMEHTVKQGHDFLHAVFLRSRSLVSILPFLRQSFHFLPGCFWGIPTCPLRLFRGIRERPFPLSVLSL